MSGWDEADSDRMVEATEGWMDVQGRPSHPPATAGR
jgi:hypothetical protein